MSLVTGGALALACLSVPAATAAPSNAAPASAARAPAWHVAFRHPGDIFEGVTAGGPDNAWAYGYGKYGGVLLHWNGDTWASVHYPGQYKNSYEILHAYVLSAGDVWFAGLSQGDAKLLHLDHGAWSWLTAPVDSGGQPVDVLADNDIWAIGTSNNCFPDPLRDRRGCTAVERWNGSTWLTYPLRAEQVVGFYGNASTGVWAAGLSYETPRRGNHPPTFVESAFRWTGSRWEQSATGRRTDSWATLVVDSRRNVWLAEPSRSAPKSCADHWNGSSWRPFYLPAGDGSCRGAVTDDRSGFWTAHGAGTLNGRGPVGFWFRHWTGTRYPATPVYVPDKTGWTTDGFTLTAVPRSARVWAYGWYCPATTSACNIQGVILTTS